MCGRYALSLLDKVQEVLPGLDVGGVTWTPRYNLAPTQDVPVMTNNGQKRVELLRWGLIPFWAKDEAAGDRMINARAESVAEKPAFRKSLERRRCLIWADGFYEWKAGPAGKVPLFSAGRTSGPLPSRASGTAGSRPSGMEIQSCTIITTSANALMAPVHDRMPVILPREAWAAWVSLDAQRADDMTALLKPYAGDDMEAYPVSRAVNNPRNEGADLIRPLGEWPVGDGPMKKRQRAENAGQGELFG